MTALHLADAGEAADLAAFLARLIHYDRAAAVRLQAGGGVLAVFGRPPSFEVLAIRTARLADDTGLDRTVSAGELLEGVDGSADELTVPAAVTGPPWTGMLPPRGGWQRVPGLPAPEALVRAVAAAVAEFRARDEALPPQHRTRTERDRIGREIWSRTLGDTHLPLRAAHAAQSLGFLRPVRTGALTGGGASSGARPAQSGPQPLSLLSAGGWLRLSTPYGSIAVRTGGPAGLTGLSGLTVTPV
ncbi:hypothetical protein SLV14_005242 [Streptomyces sp. Je 1-4]|uniref:hypothetical protein n=1 Tax=Streptomyces TaxID=1883 RepID=UPI00140EDF0E|nr:MULTISPECIES: hypothetical protein [unclassified Streptomyces]QIK08714.1 hypothetical protein G7Z12_24490 [Streptomyces sp. ID38640]UYB42381.1 hypothetical protein SLV14_005242 [Streptomyces sp. Je 1-4]UZQ38682.1 hypothetical protein SLV14N_005242 [Streptomyces sp. Je 1-4] [Streptomyces sp. Je 1-4 4N24]UZQ46099.1 hypothetical protein SLV14NA_005242 [Streptomyces sp. Je 1-4] [Streptomyces sp. Je 1-4 4N24_ara]